MTRVRLKILNNEFGAKTRSDGSKHEGQNILEQKRCAVTELSFSYTVARAKKIQSSFPEAFLIPLLAAGMQVSPSGSNKAECRYEIHENSAQINNAVRRLLLFSYIHLSPVTARMRREITTGTICNLAAAEHDSISGAKSSNEICSFQGIDDSRNRCDKCIMFGAQERVFGAAHCGQPHTMHAV